MEMRISLLDFQDGGGASASGQINHDIELTELEEALEASPSTTEACQRRLFLVETPSPDHKSRLWPSWKILNRLQSKLNVPPSVFEIHKWNETTFHFNETINCTRLPTVCDPRRRFSIEYFELWQVKNHNLFSRHMRDATSSLVTCAATKRDIQCHRWSQKHEWLLLAPRKCSFWSAKNGDGWNAVVICDPPPRRVVVNGREVDILLQAFEGGYHGFIPDHARGASTENPPHTSLFDDISYYVQNHADVLRSTKEPASAVVFLKKIVASHYCQLLGFVSHQTASMRSSGWAVQRKTQQEIDQARQVESAWSHFKCPEYFEALGHVLDSFGISQGREPFEHFDVGVEGFFGDDSEQLTAVHRKHSDWRSSTPDFLYLHREFRTRLADYARMTSSLAALNGMIGGRISILEARTARTLTLVAMLFAPPACVASIFSIPLDNFGQPGGPRFWWYWATTVPLTVLVFLLTYLVHERDLVRRTLYTRKSRLQNSRADDDEAKESC